MKVLILRPEPGASRSAARARALGLDAVVAPLFTVRPLPWSPPDPGSYQAILLTSANAARHGGEALAGYTHLPCYAVGEATAQAARSAGFQHVVIGRGDGAEALALLAQAGITHALHLCGRDHIALDHSGVAIDRRIVYVSEPVSSLPSAAGEAVGAGALALIHSPRAATLFAALTPHRASVALAAISGAAAEAAGAGWRSIDVAAAPRDEALLELAVKLCQTGRDAQFGRSTA